MLNTEQKYIKTETIPGILLKTGSGALLYTRCCGKTRCPPRDKGQHLIIPPNGGPQFAGHSGDLLLRRGVFFVNCAESLPQLLYRRRRRVGFHEELVARELTLTMTQATCARGVQVTATKVRGVRIMMNFTTRGNGTAEMEVLADVPSTEQMVQWRRTNQRMQDREEREAIRKRCAPPTRTLDFCDGNLSTGYGPVPDVRIRRDTRCGAN